MALRAELLEKARRAGREQELLLLGPRLEKKMSNCDVAKADVRVRAAGCYGGHQSLPRGRANGHVFDRVISDALTFGTR